MAATTRPRPPLAGTRIRARRDDGRRVLLVLLHDGWLERGRVPGSSAERLGPREVASVAAGGTEAGVRVTVHLHDGTTRRYRGRTDLLHLVRVAHRAGVAPHVARPAA